MSERRAARLIVEVAFLAALAAALTFAKLEDWLTVGAMAVGWILVSIFEWGALRARSHYRSGSPPRWYTPQVTLPPPRPLEQFSSSAGYPAAGAANDAPTWIASPAMLADWPVSDTEAASGRRSRSRRACTTGSRPSSRSRSPSMRTRLQQSPNRSTRPTPKRWRSPSRHPHHRPQWSRRRPCRPPPRGSRRSCARHATASIPSPRSRRRESVSAAGASELRRRRRSGWPATGPAASRPGERRGLSFGFAQRQAALAGVALLARSSRSRSPRAVTTSRAAAAAGRLVLALAGSSGVIAYGKRTTCGQIIGPRTRESRIPSFRAA